MKLGYVVSFFFYLILIGVSINSLVKLFEETTTFDEKIVKGDAILPSFTLCPNQPDDANQQIESFEDVSKTIKSVRSMFKIEYYETKPYKDTIVLYEEFNNTSRGVWYFAPRITSNPPFQTIICLIFTPSRTYRLKKEWNFSVCTSS